MTAPSADKDPTPPRPGYASPAGLILRLVGRWLATPEASVLLVLLALWAYMLAPGGAAFFSDQNRDYLLRSISLLAILAIGELVVILTGGIDLSVGSYIAFTGMFMATVMNGELARQASAWAARHAGVQPPEQVVRAWINQATAEGILAVLAAALALGVVHALLVHKLRLPAFVVTLGSMSMLRSGAMLFNNGVPATIEKFPLIIYLGNRKLFVAGTPFGLPVATVILLAIGIVAAATLQCTRVGRRVYAVGSNEEATRLSGVEVLWVRVFAYGLCSLLAGIAGILYTGYGSQGDPRSGVMLELNAISAAVIGGAILTGGRGSVVGTLLGAILLESLVSMINFRLGDPSRWQGMIVGAVLLTAVIFNQLRHLGVFARAGRFIARLFLSLQGAARTDGSRQ